MIPCATCSSGTLKEHRPQNVVLLKGGEGSSADLILSGFLSGVSEFNQESRHSLQNVQLTLLF